MRRIIQTNIDRFKELLKTETDPVKRAMLSRLLAEEEAKLEHAPKPEENMTYSTSTIIVPFAPMRRLHINAFPRFGIDPVRLGSANWKYQRMDPTAVHHTHLKIDVGSCN